MKSLYPKIDKVMSIYKIPKIGSVYAKDVAKHQFQGHYGNMGKFYGKYAKMINPYKGGDKK